MAEHQDAVLGLFEIEFHHIDTHPDDGLDGRNGILGIIAPVAAMGNDDYILGFGIVDLGHDLFRPVAGIRRGRYFRGAVDCRHGEQSQHEKQGYFFHDTM